MTASAPAGGDGPAPIVPLDGRPPHLVPLEGGGRCDRCGWRAFRRLASGLGWRHETCEPPGYHSLKLMRMAARGPRQPMVTVGPEAAKRRARQWEALQRGSQL